MITSAEKAELAERMIARVALSNASPERDAIVTDGHQIINEAGALMAVVIEASGWIVDSPDTPRVTNGLVVLLEAVYMAGVLVGRGQRQEAADAPE